MTEPMVLVAKELRRGDEQSPNRGTLITLSVGSAQTHGFGLFRRCRLLRFSSMFSSIRGYR
jgi:hypothetical protein